MAKPERILVNLSRGTIACEQLTVADSARARMRGLLGRDSLPVGEGMLLQPAPSIHTFFMRFPIDALFLDGTLQVKRIDPDMRPWKMASTKHAWAVLELASGEAERLGIAVGDQLGVITIGDEGDAPLEIPGPQTARAVNDSAPAPAIVSSANGHTEPAPEARAGSGEADRVLIIGADRRFRSVAATLLSRRGYDVAAIDRVGDVAGLISREHAAVVVLDIGQWPDGASALVKQIETLEPTVGLVVVADEEKPDPSGRTLYKWDPFETLRVAVERASRERSSKLAKA